MGTPHVEVLPSAGHLQPACGSATAAGCTRFVAYRLDTVCTTSDAGARMTAKARFTPWILLRNLDALTHEREHIRDLEQSLRAWVDALAREQFVDLAACESARSTYADGFGDVVLAFARESTIRRDAPHVAKRSAKQPSAGRASRAAASE